MNQDSFGPGLVALAVLLLLLIAWMAWFFLASIPLYETSREFQARRDKTLLVTFSPAALGRIRPGQKAVLSLDGSSGNSAQIFQAEVLNLSSGSQKTVEIYLFSPPDAATLQQIHSGLVKVEVETASPAVMLLRLSGALTGSQK